MPAKPQGAIKEAHIRIVQGIYAAFEGDTVVVLGHETLRVKATERIAEND